MRLFVLASTLLLSACVEGDLTLDFTEGDRVVTRSAIQLSQHLIDRLDVPATALCQDGDVAMTEAGAVCAGVSEGRISDFANGQVAVGGFGGAIDLSEVLKVDVLSEDRLRISIDIAGLITRLHDADPASLGQALMQRASHGDGALVLRLRAADVIGTTGGVSEDGREARVAIPTSVMEHPEPYLGGPFITVLRIGDG